MMSRTMLKHNRYFIAANAVAINLARVARLRQADRPSQTSDTTWRSCLYVQRIMHNKSIRSPDRRSTTAQASSHAVRSRRVCV